MFTTTTTFQGNLTADPQLRYMTASRGFAISQARAGGNPRMGCGS